MSAESLSDELLTCLGDEGFLKLVEAYGGTRLFVPARDHDTDLVTAIGADHARKLAAIFAGSYLRVPLARDFRARHYHLAGESNAKIARRLGITETGLQKLLTREPLRLAKSGPDPRQIDMFRS